MGVKGGGFTVSSSSGVTEGGREWTGCGEVLILVLEVDFLAALLWTGMGVGGGGFTVSTSSGVVGSGREWAV